MEGVVIGMSYKINGVSSYKWISRSYFCLLNVFSVRCWMWMRPSEPHLKRRLHPSLSHNLALDLSLISTAKPLVLLIPPFSN
jgi:hypothetical protein